MRHERAAELVELIGRVSAATRTGATERGRCGSKEGAALKLAQQRISEGLEGGEMTSLQRYISLSAGGPHTALLNAAIRSKADALNRDADTGSGLHT